MVQLENLELAVNAAMAAINARGLLLINCLHNILARAQEILLHGICRSAVVALATAHV